MYSMWSFVDEYVENINPNKLFNMHLRYTPVRSDSVVGELKLSEPTDIILPGKQSHVTIPVLLIIDIMYLFNFMGLHFFGLVFGVFGHVVGKAE